MDIIRKVKSLNLPLGEYAVFGSGPLVIRGIREAHDIDVVVTPELYQKLKKEGWKEKVWEGGGKHLAKGVFEVTTKWGCGEYNPAIDQLIDEAEIMDEIPFVRLEEVLKWKQAFGREKDKRDIQLIEDFLSKKI